MPALGSAAGPGGCGHTLDSTSTLGSTTPVEAIEALLFATATTEPAAMETEGSAAPSAHPIRDEPVTYLYVACPNNFSVAARKKPRDAWRFLLLSKSKEALRGSAHHCWIFCQ